MKTSFLFFFILYFVAKPSLLLANEAEIWLKKEIDIILNAYQNESLPNENRFLMVEQTINNNFAGAGIAKFVSGKAWNSANKETKKEYIKHFKRHLALNIASMMQGYSDQKYVLNNSSYDEKNAQNGQRSNDGHDEGHDGRPQWSSGSQSTRGRSPCTLMPHILSGLQCSPSIHPTSAWGAGKSHV